MHHKTVQVSSRYHKLSLLTVVSSRQTPTHAASLLRRTSAQNSVTFSRPATLRFPLNHAVLWVCGVCPPKVVRVTQQHKIKMTRLRVQKETSFLVCYLASFWPQTTVTGAGQNCNFTQSVPHSVQLSRSWLSLVKITDNGLPKLDLGGRNGNVTLMSTVDG